MNQIQQKILLAVPADSWRSTLEFRMSERFSRARIRQAADLDDCLKQVQGIQPAVVIVELNKAGLVADCKAIFKVSQRLRNTLWLAVSHDDLNPWRRLMWVCGIMDSCSNISRIDNLISRIERCLDGNVMLVPDFTQPQSIEERIFQSLPW